MVMISSWSGGKISDKNCGRRENTCKFKTRQSYGNFCFLHTNQSRPLMRILVPCATCDVIGSAYSSKCNHSSIVEHAEPCTFVL